MAKRTRTIRSRHAAHRATKYPIGRLLGASSGSISTTPDARPRTIAPGAPGLKLRDAPVVTFHVTIGAFGQTRRKPATLPFRNCRFLSVRKRHCCCRRNPEHKQKHRHSVKIRAHPRGSYCSRVAKCVTSDQGAAELTSNSRKSRQEREFCDRNLTLRCKTIS
jgi:hypothetical protein